MSNGGKAASTKSRWANWPVYFYAITTAHFHPSSRRDDEQRAMIAATIANLSLGANQHQNQEGRTTGLPSEPPISQAKAAEMMQVSESVVRGVHNDKSQVIDMTYLASRLTLLPRNEIRW
jgi:hypothetical protein